MTFHASAFRAHAFERAVLLAILDASDVEPVPSDDGRSRYFRLSVTLPIEALTYLELVGGGDEDDEDGDHTGCGDAEGLIAETTGEWELGATEAVNQDHAWTIGEGFTNGGEVDAGDEPEHDEAELFGIADRDALELFLIDNPSFCFGAAA